MANSNSESAIQQKRTYSYREHPKLTEEQKVTICRWIAEFKTPKQVYELTQSEWQTPLTLGNVYFYFRHEKWQPIIHRFRSEWVREIMHEPIANKRVRLHLLSQYLERTEKDATLSEAERIRACRQLLEQVRLEMAEHRTDVTNLYLQQVHLTELSDAQIVQRMQDLTEKLKTWRLPHGSTPEVLPAELRRDGSQTGAGFGDQGGRSPSESVVGNGPERSEHTAGG